MADGLTVAVTGPTGTFGFGLLPLLEADARIARVVGIARRPFEPAEHGWTKLEYRRGDVRDRDALEDAFAGADVVVHLAFMITGTEGRATIRAINVDGTLNAFRAAAAVGAQRFVYASSVAAYGFHADNPYRLTEALLVRPAAHLFYAQEKAAIEHLLAAEGEQHAELGLYVLRPPVVLGPHALGAKDLLPGPLAALARGLGGLVRRLPVPVPVAVPDLPLQFVDEDDVGQALLLSVVGAGPPGAYNLAGDGVLSAHDVARELGLAPLALPRRARPDRRPCARRACRSRHRSPSGRRRSTRHSIMDTTKARRELGWEPRYTGLDALRRTLHNDEGPAGQTGPS